MSPDRRRRAAPVAAALAGVLIVVAVAWWFARDRTADDVEPTTPSGEIPAAELVALSITGAPHAQLAVVGSGPERSPAALVLPPGTTVVAPGQGETTTEQVQALPGDGMRIASSNAVGAWAAHYGVVDLPGLGTAVDRAGGLTVELSDPVTVGGTAVGPGPTSLSGAQVEAYLVDAPSAEATGRWLSVLTALLADPPLEAGDLTGSDDAEAFVAALEAAAGADVELMPIQIVGGTTAIAAQPDLDELMGERFGTPVPTPVVVENGSGEAGVGELVGSRIIPEGYRIVLSSNAESFRYDVTQITATGQEHVDDAETIRDAIGTGEVQVTQVPSGLADVVIVTGKDLQA